MTSADLGAATEARFLLDAHRLGFRVSKPFTETPGYDMVLDNGRRLYRVQVKGVSLSRRKTYTPHYAVNINRHRRTRPKFDVVAVYLEQDARWVFLPRSVASQRQVNIFRGGKYARRGWEIFKR